MPEPYEMEEQLLKYQDRLLRAERIAGVWKWIAMLAVGVVLGGSPTYISLVIQQNKQLTIADVDKEISSQEGTIGQKVDDLKESVTQQLSRMQGQLDEIQKQQTH